MGLSKEELVGTIVLVLTDGVYATTNILHIPEGSREIIGLANVGLRLGTYSAGILMICTADLPLVSGLYEWDGTVWRDAPHAVMNLIARSGTSQPMVVQPTEEQCNELMEEFKAYLQRPSELSRLFPVTEVERLASEADNDCVCLPGEKK